MSLNFATFVPLFANSRLRFDGADNHRSSHWSGQGTSISYFSASKMSFSFKVTLVSVIHSCSQRKSLVTQLHAFHDDPGHLPQILRRASTSIAQYGFGVEHEDDTDTLCMVPGSKGAAASDVADHSLLLCSSASSPSEEEEGVKFFLTRHHFTSLLIPLF